MPTTGTVLAKNMKLYIGATAVTCQVNASLNMSTNMFQAICKDSGAAAEYFPGTKEWSISGEGLFRFDATYGFEDFYDMWDGQTSATAVFQTAVTGDLKFSGTVYISSLTADSSGNDEAVRYQFELQGTGDLDKATVS